MVASARPPQLTLFPHTEQPDPRAVATSATDATASATTTAPVTTPSVSRTRALVQAIQQFMPAARVVITDTRSTLLSQSTRDGVCTVRVHQMFLDAPDDVRHAVALYVARGDRRSGAVVDDFIRARHHLLDFIARPLRDDAWRGAHHDLLPIYDAMNARYFDGAILVQIGWGQAGRVRRHGRSSITFGSWDHRARRITIHPVLDAAHVPPLVVARVVHHEMLHVKHGAVVDDRGRRLVHGKAFRHEEATFDGAREADAWLDAHLAQLLRWRPQKAT